MEPLSGLATNLRNGHLERKPHREQGQRFSLLPPRPMVKDEIIPMLAALEPDLHNCSARQSLCDEQASDTRDDPANLTAKPCSGRVFVRSSREHHGQRLQFSPRS